MSHLGHKHAGSVAQNHKAQLATAYNDLGKELSSSKIKVVGNYTLGKVIGEGAHHSLLAFLHSGLRLGNSSRLLPKIPPYHSTFMPLWCRRYIWKGAPRDPPPHLDPRGHQADPQSPLRNPHARDTPPPAAAPSTRHTAIRGDRYGVLYLARHGALFWGRAF